MFKFFKNSMLSFLLVFLLILSIGFFVWILIPKFLETPSYSVELSDSKFQLRNYTSFTSTQVIIRGKQNEALREGFRPLVRFIGAKERSSEKISMTVPVMQEKTEQNDRWLVSFAMPSKYQLNNLPKPSNKNLSQRIMPKRLMAAIKFNGRATKELLDFKETELRKWIASQNLVAIGRVHYYFYNDPTTPGIFRRNEVLLEVSK